MPGRGLESYAIGSFRRNWRGGRDWAERHVHIGNLPTVLKELGREADMFEADLQRLAALQATIPTLSCVMNVFDVRQG